MLEVKAIYLVFLCHLHYRGLHLRIIMTTVSPLPWLGCGSTCCAEPRRIVQLATGICRATPLKDCQGKARSGIAKNLIVVSEEIWYGQAKLVFVHGQTQGGLWMSGSGSWRAAANVEICCREPTAPWVINVDTF